MESRNQSDALILFEQYAPGLIILGEHVDALPPQARGGAAGPVFYGKNCLRQIVKTHAKVSIAPQGESLAKPFPA